METEVGDVDIVRILGEISGSDRTGVSSSKARYLLGEEGNSKHGTCTTRFGSSVLSSGKPARICCGKDGDRW